MTSRRLVRDFNVAGNTSHVKKVLKVLGQDFALSSNPHSRKGGLIGLAATAIALGKVCMSSVLRLFLSHRRVRLINI